MATPQVTVSDEGKIGLSLLSDGQETVFNPFTGAIDFTRLFRSGISYLLDMLDDPAAAAFSLQAISEAMVNDPVVQIRRDTDDDEVQVLLDQSRLINGTYLLSLDSPMVGSGAMFGDFMGSANGFVRTWYDSSGNDRHATQTAALSQPLLVENGELVTENGKPAIKFPVSNTTHLNITALASVSTDEMTAFSVGRFEQVSSRYMLGADSGMFSNASSAGQFSAGGFTNATQSLRNAGSNFSFSLWAWIRNNNEQKLSAHQNGVLRQESTTYSAANTSQVSRIGARGISGFSASSSLNKPISEVILFNSDQSANRAKIESNIMKRYNL